MIERHPNALPFAGIYGLTLFSMFLFFPRNSLGEPHFAARQGLRCSRCHTSPTGGGKRTAYGTLWAASNLTIQSADPRSNPPHRSYHPSITSAVQSGEVTSWLAIGADLRLANQTTFAEQTQNSFDATEGTIYLELQPFPDRLTLYIDEEIAAGGARSREIWGMIRGPFSTYLRGGWLFPPYGLRLLDDDALTRRVSGTTFANSDLGLELGIELGPFSSAFAVTNGSFSAADPDVYKAFWWLLDVTYSFWRAGLSSMYNPSEEGCRAMSALFGSLRFGRLVLQGEADLITARPATSERWSLGFAALAELDLLITKGLSLRFGYDHHNADAELRQDRRQRFVFGLDAFLFSMMEAKLQYVLKQSETEQPLDRADRLEVVLHVFL